MHGSDAWYSGNKKLKHVYYIVELSIIDYTGDKLWL